MSRATRHNAEKIAEAVADPERLLRKPRKHKRSTSVETLSGRQPLLTIDGITLPPSANPVVSLEDIAPHLKKTPQPSTSNMDDARHEMSLPGGKNRKNPGWFCANGEPREISSDEDCMPQWFIPDMDNTRLDRTYTTILVNGWLVQSQKLTTLLNCDHLLINKKGEVWSWTYPARQFGLVSAEPFNLEELSARYLSEQEEIQSDEYTRRLAPRGRPRSLTDYPIGIEQARQVTERYRNTSQSLLAQLIEAKMELDNHYLRPQEIADYTVQFNKKYAMLEDFRTMMNTDNFIKTTMLYPIPNVWIQDIVPCFQLLNLDDTPSIQDGITREFLNRLHAVNPIMAREYAANPGRQQTPTLPEIPPTRRTCEVQTPEELCEIWIQLRGTRYFQRAAVAEHLFCSRHNRQAAASA